MSAAYLSRVVSKKPGAVEIDVFQMHPDYTLEEDEFLDMWGAMAVAGWAFPEGYARTNRGCTDPDRRGERVLPEGKQTELASQLGSFGNLFDAPVPGSLRVETTLLRPTWTGDAERARAAGLDPEAAYRMPGILQVCGHLRMTVTSDDPTVFDALPVDAEWEY